MSLEVFLSMLVVTSTLTSLVTEAIKTYLTEHNMKYYPNTLAGYVAAVLAALICIGYIVLADVTLSAPKIAVCLVALILLSWLSAMVGYDKVIQLISQVKEG